MTINKSYAVKAQCMVYINIASNACTVDDCMSDVIAPPPNWVNIDSAKCLKLYSTSCGRAVQEKKVSKQMLCEENGYKYLEFNKIHENNFNKIIILGTVVFLLVFFQRKYLKKISRFYKHIHKKNKT